MLQLFRRQPKSAIGIDLGSSAIKIVELVREDKRFRVSNYGFVSLTESNDGRGLPQRLTQLAVGDVANLIRRLLTAMGFERSAPPAAIAVSVFSSFSTLIEMPLMSESEVGQAVQFEARKVIPVPLSEVVMEWTVLQRERDPKLPKDQPPWLRFLGVGRPSVPAGAEGKAIQVMVAAVPREVLSRSVSTASQAGLKLLFLEVETFSLARALADQTPDPSLLIDIGARSTNFSIIEEGFVSLTHTVEIAGHDFTRATAEGLNILPARAEERKQTQGLSGGGGEGQIAHLMLSYVEALTTEAERVLGLHERSGSKVQRIVLAGGSARLAKLAEYVSTKLGRPVEIARPFKSLLYPEMLQAQLEELGPSFAVAVGLAQKALSG
ncbi:pilus assembly protein PilM [Candidatus Parcubacteria bacterium]|nr:pilus assembly protein PilM [Candidatus Parcubacteria bacterium]